MSAGSTTTSTRTAAAVGRSQVLVIGAGPAGCAAGITLARAGVDVCVIDRAVFPRDKTCGDAISNRAVARLEELGAMEAVRQGPHALVRRADAVFPDGSRVVRRYAEPGMIVRRIELDAALRGALSEAGARVFEGVAARALESRAPDRGYRVRGPGLDWSAELVIAADGPGSVAWSQVGRPYPRGRYLALAATVYLEGIPYPHGDDVSEHYFEHDLPCGYGWVFPATAGLANVGVYQRADAYGETKVPLRELLRRFLERHDARLGQGRPVGGVRSWSLPIGQAPWGVGARDLLLAGDAGNFIDPLSGEGIWQALETGVMAGETALAASRGEAPWERLLARHTRRCQRAIGRHCRTRARIQEGMRWLVDHELYRSRIVRGALQFAYGRAALERSKSL